MAEYKNGFNAFGGIPVDSSRLSSDVQTGRAVYVNEDKYSDEPDYKNRVDQTVNEGYHREAPFEAPEIVIPEPIIPSGTKNITENGVYDVAQFAKANVNVAGGGGSSDFSTASMAIFDASQGDAVIYPSVVNMGEFDLCVVNQGNGGTHPVVLYQGKAGVMVQANSYTVSGDATDMGDGMVLVTGDCTITIS